MGAKDINYSKLLHERKCPICGKLFYPRIPSEWGYKVYVRRSKKSKNDRGTNKKLICSWTCYKKAISMKEYSEIGKFLYEKDKDKYEL